MVEPHSADHANPPRANVEPSDVQPRVMLSFGLALTVILVMACVVSVWLFDFFKHRQQLAQKPVSPLVELDRSQSPIDRLPPAPRLEGLTAPEHLSQAVMSGGAGWPAAGPLNAARAEEELARAIWVDQKAGLVRLPIDQAMQRLANKLPVRKGGPTAAEAEQFYRRPSSTSSGRSPEGGSR